ncbi:MAG: hypothetical protein PHP54_02640 [Clostridia bacterium]|nr:hypothetical protein [Clostridia bacterium]
MSNFKQSDYEELRLDLNIQFFSLHPLGEIASIKDFITEDYDIILNMKREKPLYGFFKENKKKVCIILEDVLFFDNVNEIIQYIEIVVFDTININVPEEFYACYVPAYRKLSFKKEKEPSSN